MSGLCSAHQHHDPGCARCAALGDDDLTPPEGLTLGDQRILASQIRGIRAELTPLALAHRRTRDLACVAIGVGGSALLTALVLLAVLASHGLR